MIRHIVSLVFVFFISAAVSFSQTNNEIFERMVGPEAAMDPELTAQVLKAPAGTRISADTDSDGRMDCIYFIDTDDRHQDKRPPLLVKIVDEDGDMYRTGEGDYDSDLYIADWYGDGTIDRIIDYIDLDNDNDVDEQILYQWSDYAHFKRQTSKTYDDKAYCAVWAKDYGDDNRLWYDINYEYNQPLTQWLTDFNGDEIFVYAFFYNYEENRLQPGFENPFSFYDLDGDSYSEEVVRFGGANLSASTLRYSMDIDNDTRGSNHLDYDFSLSAIGPITYSQEKCMTLTLRGIETGHVLKWEHVRQTAKAGKWGKIHLTWDENDNNVDPVEGRKHNERWEGVISCGNEYIRQVGGPSCGPYNKRNEVDGDGSGQSAFYYSPIDHKLHLLGSEVGWIKADYDYNGSVDFIVWMDDSDGNGFFDTWKYDVDADSTWDREYTIKDDAAKVYPFEYEALHEVYVPTLGKAVRDNQKIIDSMKTVLKRREKNFTVDSIENYFTNSLAGYGKDYHLGEKIRNSHEGTRYYGDLIRERYWNRLEKLSDAQDRSFLETALAYRAGDFNLAATRIDKNLPDKPAAEHFGSYTKRFSIELANPSGRFLEHHPIVLSVETIRKTVPDFNPRNYVITEAEPRIDRRIVPSQADDVNSDGKLDELALVFTLIPNATAKLLCFYSPDGVNDISYAAKADSHRDWLDVKANIGWESNLCGFRMYYGQIDFFGKRLEGLRLKNPGENYHRISDWGMDVLHVGTSSGLGGIGIWEGGNYIPVMNPGGEGNVSIERKILSCGPVRALVRVDVTGIRTELGEYSVIMVMSAWADNRFSRQDITIETTAADSVIYSPGLMKLPHDVWHLDTYSGTLTNWGFSDREAGDIGLGLMFDPGEFCGYAESDTDRYVKLKIPAGKCRTHWIIGGWRKGFVSPTSPTARDWAYQVEELGLCLQTPVVIRCEKENE